MRNFLARFRRQPDAVFAPPVPDQPVQVVGDIHGRIDLLATMLDRLDLTEQVVFVGDLIDRGDQSREVLNRMFEMAHRTDFDIRVLMGNHEAMLLRFIGDPSGSHRTWLRTGGLQTLASYGLAPPAGEASPEDWRTLRDELMAGIGRDVLRWLDGLPVIHRTGNLAVVHAAADPARAIDLQDSDTLIWGHPEFRKSPRRDGVWVAHGHTIVDQPMADQGRISVDTGAYATGVLTAARIGFPEDGDQVVFVTA